MKREVKLFFAILAMTAFAMAMSDGILSNYLKDVYDISPYQRGLIEFPRELPGILCVLIISGLSFLNDIRIAMIAQIFTTIGIMVLGFFTPTFTVMLLFLFTFSLGMHLFMPLQDSIAMSLVPKEKVNVRMGQFKGMFTAFQMAGSLLIFLGFRYNFFTFESSTKIPFIIAGVLFLIVFLMLNNLTNKINASQAKHKKTKFILRKEYKYYYILVIMFGVQKQIMIVYGPWVIIDLLGKKADTIAMLWIIGGFIGIFFIPMLGRWLDRFGIKRMLYLDALSFIAVYLLYGLLSGGYYNGTISKTGLPVILAYFIFILDRMSTQMTLIRTVYLKSIARSSTEITSTLSLGMSMDHVVSITSAYIGGIIWMTKGPQYIFYFAALLSLINLFVAFRVKETA